MRCDEGSRAVVHADVEEFKAQVASVDVPDLATRSRDGAGCVVLDDERVPVRSVRAALTNEEVAELVLESRCGLICRTGGGIAVVARAVAILCLRPGSKSGLVEGVLEGCGQVRDSIVVRVCSPSAGFGLRSFLS